jgi:hypothetical protein
MAGFKLTRRQYHQLQHRDLKSYLSGIEIIEIVLKGGLQMESTTLVLIGSTLAQC